MKEAKSVRAEYTEGLRRDFRDYAIRIHLAEGRIDPAEDFVLPYDFNEWQIHHVQPISLGGRNDFLNLALVAPDTHREIHGIIDQQTKGMSIGDSRTIDLPYMHGHIWKRHPHTMENTMRKKIAAYGMAAAMVVIPQAKAQQSCDTISKDYQWQLPAGEDDPIPFTTVQRIEKDKFCLTFKTEDTRVKGFTIAMLRDDKTLPVLVQEGCFDLKGTPYQTLTPTVDFKDGTSQILGTLTEPQAQQIYDNMVQLCQMENPARPETTIAPQPEGAQPK